jgi:hypothetical protein
VLKGVVLKAGPFSAGALCGATPAVMLTEAPYGVESGESVSVVWVVVCALTIEQRREHEQRTAELSNRGMEHLGEFVKPSNQMLVQYSRSNNKFAAKFVTRFALIVICPKITLPVFEWKQSLAGPDET